MISSDHFRSPFVLLLLQPGAVDRSCCWFARVDLYSAESHHEGVIYLSNT